MATLTQSGGILPGDFETLDQLTAAVNRGQCRKFDAIITQVLVDGVDALDTLPRAPAGSIAYRFTVIGTEASFDLPEPVKPYSRRALERTRIMGARVGDPATVVVLGSKFYLHVQETFDPYGCSQQPVEA